MRFAPDSVSGLRLIAHEVGEAEIAATQFFRWNFQIGGAITLPLPFLGTCVFIKSKHLVLDENGDLDKAGTISIPVHELCHSAQIAEWGAFTYLRRQIWARIKTFNVYAKSSPEEKPCYEKQDTVGERLSGGG